MRRWVGLGSSLLLAALGPAGCSGGGDDGGASGSELGARYCALFAPCCQAAGFPPNDQQACKLLFSAPPKDAAAGEACIAEYEERARAADWCDTFAAQPRPESCEIAYPETPDPGGTAKPGEPCEFTSDCATPAQGRADCHSDLGSGTSYCRVVVDVGSGQACAGTRDGSITFFEGDSGGALEVGVCDTADGVFCNAGTCAPIAQIGGACTSSMGCVDGAYCGSGTCKAKVPAGSSCAESSSACDDQSYCPFPGDVCLARVADGSPCDDWDQCLSGYCNSEGTCAPASSAGGPLALALFCN